MPAHPCVLHIALPVPLRRCFDYLAAPNATIGAFTPGQRIKVTFGHRLLVGILISADHHSELSLDKLKPIEAVLDPAPLLSKPIFDRSESTRLNSSH